MVISNTINNDLTSRFIKEHFDVEDHWAACLLAAPLAASIS